MKIQLEEATPVDREIVKRQCGMENVPIYGVAARCSNGIPQVVLINPVIDKEQNKINYGMLSELVWLSCPKMRARIKELEDRGMINRAQQMLHKERALATMMNDAHAHFYFLRKEIFRRIMGREYIDTEFCFFDMGIGGIRDARVVKCLHLHYAHYKICPENMVGRAVEGIIGEDSYCGCEEQRCKL